MLELFTLPEKNWRQQISIDERLQVNNLIDHKQTVGRWSYIESAFLYLEKGIGTYSLRIDLESGDLYVNQRTHVIFKNMLVATAIRPLQIAIKTIYHIIYPLSAYLGWNAEKKLANKLQLNAFDTKYRCLDVLENNLLDIFRTPLYGFVLLVMQIATLIIYPFSEEKFLNFRALCGAVEMALVRGRKKAPWANLFPYFENVWALALCMTPLDNITAVKRRSFTKDGVNYRSFSKGTTAFGLSNLANTQYNHYLRSTKQCPFKLLM